MKKKFTIAIEGGGTTTAISVLKGLSIQKEFNVRTILLDITDEVSGKYFADKFYITSPSKDDDYIEQVLNICKKESVDIYIPIIDYGFEKLSDNTKKFNALDVYIMITNPLGIAVCADKYATFNFFLKNYIPTPKTWQVSHKIPKGLTFPFIVKPRCNGRASLDVHVIDDVKSFSFYTQKNNNYIIQELVHGKEFTADCLSSLDGSVYIASCIRERTEIKGGLSIKGKIVNKVVEKNIQIYLKKIIETLKIPGVCNIQGFISDKNKIYFTEINPRFAGTHAYTIQVGLNSILQILRMLNGKQISDIKSKIKINHDIQFLRYWNEVFINKNTGKIWTWENSIKD